MKRILSKFIALGSIGLLALTACKKDGALVTSNGGKAGALTANTMTLVLDKTKLNDPSAVINFSFTAPNYGFSAAVNNTLQIDLPGDNWKNPTSATLSTKVYAQGYSTSDFNNLLLKLNVPAGVATPVVVRVMHSVSAQVAPIYSNVLNMTVTCFNLTSYVYVPGAYEGSSWPNPGPLEDSLVSVTGNGVYTGIINFPSGGSQFLIVPIKGSWANKYATTDNPGTGTTATFSTEYVSSGGNNFQAPSAGGNYWVTLNVNTSQLTIVPADYYSIIGSSTPGGNWSTDLWLKFINDGNNNWVGTFAMLAGEYKFRLDGQWTTSWGPGATAGTAVTSGATGDGNIQLSPAGTYTFTLNQPPTVVGGATGPLATATFTAVKQ